VIHQFKGVIPTKFKGRDGVEKTSWKDAGFEMIYDDQKDHYWGRFNWWPEGCRMLIQPPRENKREQEAPRSNPAPTYQQAPEDDLPPF
jgi:hypothetical protein